MDQLDEGRPSWARSTARHQDYHNLDGIGFPRGNTGFSKERRILFWAFILFLCGLFIFFWGLRSKNDPDGEYDWDILIFTQRWPYTDCLEMKVKRRNFTCRLIEEGTWSIHGIWPSKLNTIGPQYCKTTLQYNSSQLTPIIDTLRVDWFDVDMNQTGEQFWRYEWNKHGVCSLSFTPLNSQLKYFKQAIDWLERYNMLSVLGNATLSPDDVKSTNSTSILLAVEKNLGVKSGISCFFNKKTKKYYLKEIKVCFDKTLRLIDCKGMRQEFAHPCPDDKPIFYPRTVPPQI